MMATVMSRASSALRIASDMGFRAGVIAESIQDYRHARFVPKKTSKSARISQNGEMSAYRRTYPMMLVVKCAGVFETLRPMTMSAKAMMETTMLRRSTKETGHRATRWRGAASGYRKGGCRLIRK